MNTAIITAILGCAGGILAGILGYIKFFTERKDTKQMRDFETILEQHLAPLKEENNQLLKKISNLESHNLKQDNQLKEIRLDTTRTQFYQKMDDDTHNHDTIFAIAHRYFMELKGNWTAAIDFQTWAKKEKVEIPPALMQAIIENEQNSNE